jgi:predicted MFS family arabinose efflux permease
MGVFMLGIPIAVLVGGPFSGGLLELDGVLGLEGWQWLFLVQGAPAVGVGLWLLRALPDRPTDAPWLERGDAVALEEAVAAEAKSAREREDLDLRGALRDRRVWRLALIYTCLNAAGYGTIFFLADLIDRIGGLSDFEVGLLSTIPFGFGALGLVLIGRYSDRTGDRRRMLAAGLALGAVGLLGVAVLPPAVGIVPSAVATFGLLGAIPAFWGIPAALLTGRAAAGGIALVNSIGVMGGLIGPVVMGTLKDATGGLEAGLVVLAGVLCVGVALTLRLRATPGTSRGPAAAGPLHASG